MPMHVGKAAKKAAKKAVPRGSHRMPDGTIMRNSAMVAKKAQPSKRQRAAKSQRRAT